MTDQASKKEKETSLVGDQGVRPEPPYHCAPGDYVAMIDHLKEIEAGGLNPFDMDWRTKSGVLWRMLEYALASQGGETPLRELVEKWRTSAEDERRKAFDLEQDIGIRLHYGYDDILRTVNQCADELAALLTPPRERDKA